MAKAKQNIGDLRLKTEDEIVAEIAKLQQEAFNIRFQRASGQNDNIGRVRGLRRNVARLKTVQSERKLGLDFAKGAKAAKPAAKKAKPAKKAKE
ncbi:MAG: 50S ribosomal protein L29 [Dongiaceae bacterium]